MINHNLMMSDRYGHCTINEERDELRRLWDRSSEGCPIETRVLPVAKLGGMEGDTFCEAAGSANIFAQ